MEEVEDKVTTALDALAVLMFAAGVLVGLWPAIAGWSIACGGAVVFLGVRVVEGDLHTLVAATRRALVERRAGQEKK